MNSPKRILICPLDWGLGHATRCIPIIRLLLKKNAEIIIAADGRPLELLKLEFPQLQFVQLKGYDISYPASGSMSLKMIGLIPKILKGIKNEHRETEKIINDLKIDLVISDNRYGCWSSKVKSIFITHQLMIKSPIAEKFLHNTVLSFIKKYTECWVPDYPSGHENLSGDLSHKYSISSNTFFIGPLSRFNVNNKGTKEYDVMAIISGPEPQRTIFEQLVTSQLCNSNLKALIVCGTPENKKKEQKVNVKICSHLESEEMEQAILTSDIIIARSGYSTIMDLARLNKKAILVPTPRQTEQEYLATTLMNKKITYSESQKEFNLNRALKEVENYKGFNKEEMNEKLQERIDNLF